MPPPPNVMPAHTVMLDKSLSHDKNSVLVFRTFLALIEGWTQTETAVLETLLAKYGKEVIDFPADPLWDLISPIRVNKTSVLFQGLMVRSKIKGMGNRARVNASRLRQVQQAMTLLSKAWHPQEEFALMQLYQKHPPGSSWDSRMADPLIQKLMPDHRNRASCMLKLFTMYSQPKDGDPVVEEQDLSAPARPPVSSSSAASEPPPPPPGGVAAAAAGAGAAPPPPVRSETEQLMQATMAGLRTFSGDEFSSGDGMSNQKSLAPYGTQHEPAGLPPLNLPGLGGQAASLGGGLAAALEVSHSMDGSLGSGLGSPNPSPTHRDLADPPTSLPPPDAGAAGGGGPPPPPAPAASLEAYAPPPRRPRASVEHSAEVMAAAMDGLIGSGHSIDPPPRRRRRESEDFAGGSAELLELVGERDLRLAAEAVRPPPEKRARGAEVTLEK